MDYTVFIIVGVYILIGIFVGSAFENSDNSFDSSFDMFIVYVMFWPIIIAAVLLLVILSIPYILGKWVGRFIHDLWKVI